MHAPGSGPFTGDPVGFEVDPAASKGIEANGYDDRWRNVGKRMDSVVPSLRYAVAGFSSSKSALRRSWIRKNSAVLWVSEVLRRKLQVELGTTGIAWNGPVPIRARCSRTPARRRAN